MINCQWGRFAKAAQGVETPEDPFSRNGLGGEGLNEAEAEALKVILVVMLKASHLLKGKEFITEWIRR